MIRIFIVVAVGLAVAGCIPEASQIAENTKKTNEALAELSRKVDELQKSFKERKREPVTITTAVGVNAKDLCKKIGNYTGADSQPTFSFGNNSGRYIMAGSGDDGSKIINLQSVVCFDE